MYRNSACTRLFVCCKHEPRALDDHANRLSPVLTKTAPPMHLTWGSINFGVSKFFDTPFPFVFE